MRDLAPWIGGAIATLAFAATWGALRKTVSAIEKKLSEELGELKKTLGELRTQMSTLAVTQATVSTLGAEQMRARDQLEALQTRVTRLEARAGGRRVGDAERDRDEP